MVKTIFLDSLLMPALGMLLGMSMPKPEASQTGKPWFNDRWFYYRFIFGSVFGYGTGIACYLIAPDWMWMYILDSRLVTWPLLLYISLMYNVLLFAGLLIAATMPANRRVLWWWVGLLLAGVTLICAIWFSRLGFVGSLSEFRLGTARPMFQISPLQAHMIGRIMIVAAFLGTGVFFGMYRANKRISEK